MAQFRFKRVLEAKMNPLRCITYVLLLICTLLSVQVLEAATYYVSPSGSDSNSGTQGQPFRNIQAAANLVNPGDTVLVSPGTYPASVSAGSYGVYIPTKSGSAGA